ncbi:C3HC zinc finger-like-domain-containing protein [Powellomyces hirtus]|nr:C3HC zinc finger-like-domain-containing protein [Powellomyces hirtus]
MISKRKLDEAIGSLVGSLPAGSAKIQLKDSNLYRRLVTFKEWTWFGLPDSLSPPNCARHGWINSGRNTLLCTACQATFSCPPTEVSSETTQELVTQYDQQLQQAHDSGCPWAMHSMDESSYRFPLTSPPQANQIFRLRYDELLSHSSDVPVAVLKNESERPLHISSIITSLGLKMHAEAAVGNACVLLALFGWEFEDLGAFRFLKCSLCARRAGLWNFSKICSSERRPAEGPHKRTKLTRSGIPASIPAEFDVSEQHRWFCPWIHIGRDTGQHKAGWVATVDSVQPPRMRQNLVQSPSISRPASPAPSLPPHGERMEVQSKPLRPAISPIARETTPAKAAFQEDEVPLVHSQSNVAESFSPRPSDAPLPLTLPAGPISIEEFEDSPAQQPVILIEQLPPSFSGIGEAVSPSKSGSTQPSGFSPQPEIVVPSELKTLANGKDNSKAYQNEILADESTSVARDEFEQPQSEVRESEPDISHSQSHESPLRPEQVPSDHNGPVPLLEKGADIADELQDVSLNASRSNLPEWKQKVDQPTHVESKCEDESAVSLKDDTVVSLEEDGDYMIVDVPTPNETQSDPSEEEPTTAPSEVHPQPSLSVEELDSTSVAEQDVQGDAIKVVEAGEENDNEQSLMDIQSTDDVDAAMSKSEGPSTLSNEYVHEALSHQAENIAIADDVLADQEASGDEHKEEAELANEKAEVASIGDLSTPGENVSISGEDDAQESLVMDITDNASISDDLPATGNVVNEENTTFLDDEMMIDTPAVCEQEHMLVAGAPSPADVPDMTSMEKMDQSYMAEQADGDNEVMLLAADESESPGVGQGEGQGAVGQAAPSANKLEGKSLRSCTPVPAEEQPSLLPSEAAISAAGEAREAAEEMPPTGQTDEVSDVKPEDEELPFAVDVSDDSAWESSETLGAQQEWADEQQEEEQEEKEHVDDVHAKDEEEISKGSDEPCGAPTNEDDGGDEEAQTEAEFGDQEVIGETLLSQREAAFDESSSEINEQEEHSESQQMSDEIGFTGATEELLPSDDTSFEEDTGDALEEASSEPVEVILIESENSEEEAEEDLDDGEDEEGEGYEDEDEELGYSIGDDDEEYPEKHEVADADDDEGDDSVEVIEGDEYEDESGMMDQFDADPTTKMSDEPVIVDLEDGSDDVPSHDGTGGDLQNPEETSQDAADVGDHTSGMADT